MKRVLIAVLLLALVAGMGFGKSIIEADGTDWLRWPGQIKLVYLYGYCSAIYTTIEGIDLAYKDEVVPPMDRLRDFMEQMLRLRFTAIIQRMDRFYMNPDNLQVPIWLALWRIEHPEFEITADDLLQGRQGDNG